MDKNRCPINKIGAWSSDICENRSKVVVVSRISPIKLITSYRSSDSTPFFLLLFFFVLSHPLLSPVAIETAFFVFFSLDDAQPSKRHAFSPRILMFMRNLSEDEKFSRKVSIKYLPLCTYFNLYGTFFTWREIRKKNSKKLSKKIHLVKWVWKSWNKQCFKFVSKLERLHSNYILLDIKIDLNLYIYVILYIHIFI